MTQSSTLGAVPTSSGATVRSNLNLSDQALATDNAGASAPSPAYPNMRWNDGTQVWRRNPGNTGWDLALDGQGFRNRIINGNFDIWQRGTSLGSGSGARYLADRWRSASIGSTYTVSQQPFSVGDTTVSAQAVYFHRVVVTSVANAANYCVLAQRIEGVRRLASKTATIALWAKADASKPMAIDLAQCFGTGGSPSSTVSAIGATKVNLTTSWQKLTVTASVPSISGKTLGSNGDDYLELNLWFDAGSNFDARTGTLGQQSGTFDIAQVQVEEGSVATPFEMRPMQAEVALCQRYYQVTGALIQLSAYASANGQTSYQTFVFPVSMRTGPTCSNTWASGVNNAGQTTANVAYNHVQLKVTANAAGSFSVQYSAGNTFDAEL